MQNCLTQQGHGLQKDVTKAVLVATEENDVLMLEAEILVAFITGQERKDEVISKSTKCKKELKDHQTGVKYHKIYHTKKAKSEYEREMILTGKELKQKKKKRMISNLISNLLSSPTHLCGILAPKKVVEKDKSRKKLPSCMFDDFHTHFVETNLKTKESNMHEKLTMHFPGIFTEE